MTWLELLNRQYEERRQFLQINVQEYGSVRAAAKALGINRTDLYRRLKKLEIKSKGRPATLAERLAELR